MVVDTTTGSPITVIAVLGVGVVGNASCTAEGLFTCSPLNKRRPNESFGFGDLPLTPKSAEVSAVPPT